MGALEIGTPTPGEPAPGADGYLNDCHDACLLDGGERRRNGAIIRTLTDQCPTPNGRVHVPPSPPAHQVKQLLVRWRSGDQGALDEPLFVSAERAAEVVDLDDDARLAEIARAKPARRTSFLRRARY